MTKQEKREKIIKGLECHAKLIGCRAHCPYWHIETLDCSIELADDVLALLKSQEPVKPYMDFDGRDVWRCGNCHRNIFHPGTGDDDGEKNYRKFCFHCGRAVKWE